MKNLALILVFCGGCIGRTATPFAGHTSDMVPAFPGAGGAGRWATGGRGGAVLEVTHLGDDGVGSLRWAVESDGPRIVVFRVSGDIRLKTRLVITNPDITIAGQTSPGGICIRDLGVRIQADNVIIRHIRIRPGDNLGVETNALMIMSGTNIIVDHVSTSWAVDQVLDIYSYPADTVLDNVTLQNSIISEGLRYSVHHKTSYAEDGTPSNGHSCGGIVRGGFGAQYSLHHNLYAHHQTRMPMVQPITDTDEDPDGLSLDFVGNVVYNWGSTTATRASSDFGRIVSRWVDNTYLTGPDTPLARAYYERSPFSSGYFEGNTMDGDTDSSYFFGFATGVDRDAFLLDTEPHIRDTVDSSPVPDVLYSVGASCPRDSVDARVVGDVIFRTGSIIDDEDDVGGWPDLTSLEPPADSDHDGMPDDWEISVGLDPYDSLDGALDRDGDGYTNIEEYINQIC